MLKKSVLYVLLFLFALFSFLLCKAPAVVVWEKVLTSNPSLQNSMQTMGLNVESLDGTIWDGQALVRYKGVSSIVDWRLKLTKVYTLSLPLELDVRSQAGEIKALVNAGFSGLDMHVLKADIDLSALTPAFRSQRLTLDGNLLAKDLKAKLVGGQLKSAGGTVSWSGGDIAYPAQRATHERSLPSFRATLETRPDGEVYAGVRDSGGAFDVLELSLDSEGQALVKVKRRLLDLADEHWPKNSNEQDTVFKIKKMIY